MAALLAGVVSFYASSSPDGLERVAEDKGFIDRATDHALGEQPLADYGEVGGIPVGLAGLAGVGVTLVAGGGLFVVVRRRGQKDTEGTGQAAGAARTGDAGRREDAGDAGNRASV